MMAKLLNDLEILPILARVRQSRGRWRILAFVALAAVLITATVRVATDRNFPGDMRIARIVIEGTIVTNPTRLARIEALEDNDNVAGVIILINSPGGSTAGGEELYESLRALADHKPVVAVINELGASAAYMTAIGADRIFSRRLSIVGSIGVLVQHMNAGGLLETIGIDFDKVASGPLKAEPDLGDPLEGDVRASLQALVDDSFDWFVDIVSQERALDRAEVLELADGRVMTGRVAMENGLIDAIGGEREAMEWLEAEHNIEADLPIVTHFPIPENDLERFSRYLGGEAGSAFSGFAREMLGPNGAGLGGLAGLGELDGLVSVWHPAVER